jgi:signal transduction histidine kinase
MPGRVWMESQEVPDGSTALVAVGLAAEERSLFAAFADDLEAATGVHFLYASSVDGGLGRFMALRARGTPCVLLASAALGERNTMRLVRSVSVSEGLVPVVVLGTRGDAELLAEALAARACDVLLRQELDVDRLARSVRFAVEIARRDLVEEAARARAREQDDLFETVWDLVEDGLLVVDGDHRVRRSNAAAARYLAIPGNELAETPFSSLPWSVPGNGEAGTFSAEEIAADIERPGGEKLRVALKIRPLARRAGAHERVRLVAIRRRAEAAEPAALSAEARHFAGLGRFLAAAAHDFGNLMTPLLGYCELLVSKLPDETPLRGYALEIERSARLAAELSFRLRDTARSQPVTEGTVAPDRCLLELAGLLRSLVGRGIEVTEELRSGELTVPLHAGEIEQIVLNLAANARDSMPLGGRLTIRSRAIEGGRWRLEVVDSGSGIPPENLGRLFDPAFTTKAAGKGTGLGLWIVRSLVEQAGGDVSVKSALGRGTVVTVELPARSAGEAAGGGATIT